MLSTQGNVAWSQVGVALENLPVIVKGELLHLDNGVSRFKESASAFVPQVMESKVIYFKNLAGPGKCGPDAFGVKWENEFRGFGLPLSNIPRFLGVLEYPMVALFLTRVLGVSNQPGQLSLYVITPSQACYLSLSAGTVERKPHKVMHWDRRSIVPIFEVLRQPIQFVLGGSPTARRRPADQALVFADRHCILDRLERHIPSQWSKRLEHNTKPNKIIASRRRASGTVAPVSDVSHQLANRYLGRVPVTQFLLKKVQRCGFGSAPVSQALKAFFVFGHSIGHRVSFKVLTLTQDRLTALYPSISQKLGAERLSLAVYNLAIALYPYLGTIASATLARPLGNGSQYAPSHAPYNFGRTLEHLYLSNTEKYSNNNCLGAPANWLSQFGNINKNNGFGSGYSVRCTDDGLGRFPHN